MIIGDKVYLGDEDGDVVVVEHSKTMKVVSEQNMGSAVYSTAVPANGAIFIMNRNQLWSSSRAPPTRNQAPRGRHETTKARRSRR